MTQDGWVKQEKDKRADGSLLEISSDNDNNHVASSSGAQEHDQEADSTEDEPAAELPSVTPTSNEGLGQAAKTRGDGDWALYAYLFNSVGTFAMMFWLFLVVVAATLEKMPC